ncbi:MAG: hypothetical protein COW85_11275 [Ignavibacteria bacterium CG22_combo_CG10-13_8_21_14_all_37_15]|nr:MAG: hypothetical protein AUJ54_03780 [Ignavibacteria bacterium CG1_02_37_35]PIP76991.1 MAG: hypothetical protein COW85_11275 [Ignavibacteria bacterium CG22_combo_CG10-13_8_21_14_all_37_15]PIS43954.1 MAG: hypothetical protein COT22_13115 [Ignavibacteria bacterium CG08_land_8_20_14_0_20_37_9]PIX93240.1 MAG: hypothetical protein COZ25_11685 [Ignavibacteria bacterium CG_4_10_14_3_um_filter_37_18]PJC57702.1 MAG: hypothetical protein CO025_11990 [Ignavibacteria bacterium CG_4_9_14_0_2_um_filter_3
MFDGLDNIVRKNYKSGSYFASVNSTKEFISFLKIYFSIHLHFFQLNFDPLSIDNKKRKGS